MNITQKNIINKICAILVIFALTMSDFLLVGKSAISYALDETKTNNANIELSAYFEDANGEKKEKIEGAIDSIQNLTVEIAVKNEGYFNGSIRLKNSNFKFVTENETYEGIQSVGEEEIKLEQINAGSTRKISLKIEAKKNDKINEMDLSNVSTVELDGNYVNSKNVEKDKSIEIKGTANVEVDWKSSEQTNLELESKLLTNSVYNVKGNSKKIVQILVNNKITNNNYPVQNTEIKLSVPEEVQDVNVFARSTKATNGELEFSNANYEYNRDEKLLTIKVSNENKENISWIKNVQDTFIVTYVLNKDDNINGKDVSIDAVSNLYDGKQLNANQNVHIEEEIDGVISGSIESSENEIYKGKIYTGEEREYTVTNKVNIDYLDIIDNVNIKEQEAKFLSNENELSANIIYKESKIRKEEFLSLFGEDGYINVKDINGTILTNINKDSQVNENGEFVISYLNGESSIEFETSKPIKLGTLNIENKKSILSTNYDRNQINSLTGIKETSEINGKLIEKTISLKNTSSQASLDVSTTTLSSTEKNENVKITAVLLNNDESKDLYRNPVIKVALPKQITNVSAKCKVLYGNGLELASAIIDKENDSFVIKIGLEGTQNSYNQESIEGTTIIIYADFEVDKLSADSNEKINLNYSNEYATSYNDNGEQSKNVKINGSSGIITSNNIKEYQIETVGNQGTQTVELDLGKEAKEATTNIGIVNNEGQEIKDVKILGKFPTGADMTLGAKLASGIVTDNENVKIYYTDNENATDDINNEENMWTLNYNNDSSKKYLIHIDSMKNGEKFDANYKVNIPANLTYNMTAEESYTVKYTNSIENEKTADATVLNLSTGKKANVEASLKAFVGDEEIKKDSNVYNGEVVRYELTLKNNGSEKATNVNVEATIPENAKCVQYIKSTEREETDTTLGAAKDYYKDRNVEENKLKTTIDSLDVNEEKTLSYEVKVENNKTMTAKSNISYYALQNDTEMTNVESNTISNDVLDAEVDMSIFMIGRSSAELRSQVSYAYKVMVKNTSGKNLSNIKMNVKINSGFSIDRVVNPNKQNVKFDNNTFVIDSLSKDESAEYEIDVKATGNNEIATIGVVANDKYHSNNVSETVELTKLSISMRSDNEGKTVNDGEKVTYNITLKNNGTEDINYLEIKQQLSTYLSVNKVTINGVDTKFEKEFNTSNSETQTQDNNQEDDKNITEKSDEYTIGFNYQEPLSVGKDLEIQVETSTDSEFKHSNNIQMASTAEATAKNIKVQSEEINHILKANVNEENSNENNNNGTNNNGNNNGNNSNNNNNNNNNSNNSSNNNGNNQTDNKEEEQVLSTISGTAWFDKNENGQRDSEEETLKGIKATILNMEDNTTQETATGDNGFYSFANVKKGKYVVIFEYDTEKYVLTKYQVEGIQESRNSDVENVTMNLNGSSKKVASTDTIEVKESSIGNIDIGLVEAKLFDLKLSKTVSKITVTNKAGTKTTEYNDSTLAKAEVKAKDIAVTTAVIEYKIKVTNEGELAGYAKKIVDYKPNDLGFNSSLNSEWYQSGNELYTTSLNNTKIEPGETKELTLVLTKTMTETNTGLVNNSAEISEDYNMLGIADKDSTPGNKKNGEDDMASANVIISVSTGAAVSYVLLTISLLVIVGAAAYLVMRKVIKEKAKF